MQACTLCAVFIQRLQMLRIPRCGVFPDQIGDIRMSGDAVQAAKRPALGAAQNGHDLIGRKGVVLSLNTLAVRVLTAAVSACGRFELAKDIIRRSARDPGVKCIVRALVSLRVRDDEQGVVIKHLFKMGL